MNEIARDFALRLTSGGRPGVQPDRRASEAHAARPMSIESSADPAAMSVIGNITQLTLDAVAAALFAKLSSRHVQTASSRCMFSPMVLRRTILTAALLACAAGAAAQTTPTPAPNTQKPGMTPRPPLLFSEVWRLPPHT